MSKQTMQYLNGGNILAGYTDHRGDPWWYDEELMPNREYLYPRDIPIEDVKKKLFGWQILEADAWAHLEDGRQVQHHGRKMLCRSDTGAVVGEASKKYNPHVFDEWLLKNVSDIIDNSDLNIANAGLLKGGSVAWVQVELSENVETKQGVVFRPFLLAATSLDQSIPTIYKRAVTNVVCDNTMSAALSEKGQEHKTKHYKNSKLAPLTVVRDALSLVLATQDAFAAEVEELCRIRVSDRIWQKVLELAVPIKEGAGVRAVNQAEKKRDELHELRDSDPRVAPWGKTGWGVVQAFNTWEQHFSGVREVSVDGSANRLQKNMLNTIKGGMDKFDASSRDLLMAALSS